jgi:hypothetical protein
MLAILIVPANPGAVKEIACSAPDEDGKLLQFYYATQF